MKCIHCDHETRVLATRPREGQGIVRRRECHGPRTHRFTTQEQVIPDRKIRNAERRLAEKIIELIRGHS